MLGEKVGQFSLHDVAGFFPRTVPPVAGQRRPLMAIAGDAN
jgi:hypothetical protein